MSKNHGHKVSQKNVETWVTISMFVKRLVGGVGGVTVIGSITRPTGKKPTTQEKQLFLIPAQILTSNLLQPLTKIKKDESWGISDVVVEYLDENEECTATTT